MVKIAVAGGSGQVAREVIDALVATNKHNILILSRKDVPAVESRSGVTWRMVNYDNKNSLAEALQGVETVFSFLQSLSDPGKQSEKNLIDACVIGGVKRFAPSEWGSSGLVGMQWWEGKQVIRDYLTQLNTKSKVLEYCLFQPGLFLEYLASPYKTAKYLDPLDTMIDFQNRRAIVVDGVDSVLALTSVEDVAKVAARLVEYKGDWPEVGGICGNRMTISQILEIGERVRGRAFSVETVELKDLEAGELKTSWVLGKKHDAVPNEQVAAFVKNVLIGTLLSSAKGAWDSSDEINCILPDYSFTAAEEFLA